MNRERWKILMQNDDEKLTPKEIAEGWHFCDEMDGLLANSKDPSGDCFCANNLFRRSESPITSKIYDSTKPKITAQQFEIISNLEISANVLKEYGNDLAKTLEELMNHDVCECETQYCRVFAHAEGMLASWNALVKRVEISNQKLIE